MWGRVTTWFKMVKEDAVILYYAWKHPLTPPYIKALMVAVIAYIFSPIDILPDYLPLIGMADDAVLLPTALIAITKLLPAAVYAECSQENRRWQKRLPWLVAFLAVMMLVWLILSLVGIGYLISK